MIKADDASAKLQYKPLGDVHILDSGSAITLAGEQTAAEWIQTGFAVEVKPLPKSIRGIRGIGALNHVTRWIRVTVDVGGAFVTVHDIPVIREHQGFLIGNDFLGKGRASIQYNTDTTGTLTLRDQTTLAPISFAVGFRSVPMSECHLATILDSPTASINLAADFGDVSDEERTALIQQQEQAAEVERELSEIAPVAWAPETIEVPAWSEMYFKVRVPATLVKARNVLLLPLEDERSADLGVLIAPTLQRVTKDGYAMCRAINTKSRKVRIPLLTPLARFQIDPRVYRIEHEFTADEIVEKINTAEDLSTSERAQVRQLVQTRRALFRTKLGYAHGYKMAIKVKPNEKAPNATLRLRSDEEEKALNQEVEKQHKAGLIEPCRSPYGALPMLVKKPTKEGQPQQWRMVLNYTGVNTILDKDVYRLPSLAGNLSKLGKANWFSTCDLLQGFHQCEIEDSAKEITAFNTPAGQYQYVRMPMGLASSPSTFMRLVDATLRGLPPGIALAYVDDICIPTAGTFEEHMRDVGMVFDRLIEAGFTVRCDKVFIGMKEVPYLGFMVGAYGTRPLAEKTQAIFDIAIKDMIGNPAAAARYAGMLGFYSKFIPNLQIALGPFHDLKAKAAPVAHIIGDANNVPSLKFLASFIATRHLLATITALARPDPTQPYYIHVDAASSCGIGAILMQREHVEDPESLRPIEIWSRRLSDEERGYSVRDQECLGLVEALKQWRHYIVDSDVTILSDHSSLQWLLSTPHPDNSHVAKWALTAQNYRLTINFIPGSKNIVADFFSRHAKSPTPAQEQSAAGKRGAIEDRLDEANEPDSIISTFAAMQAEAPTTRKAKRSALLLLRREQTGQFSVLVDKLDGNLPAVTVDREAHRFSYRQQLTAALRWDYDAATLQALQQAASFKNRHSETATSECHYFTSVVDNTFEASEASSTFVALDEALLASLSESEDTSFIRFAARQLSIAEIDTTSARSKWIGSFAKAPFVQTTATTAVSEPSVDTIATKPCGPAFCDNIKDGLHVIDLIDRRVRTNKELSMAVDLEGLLGGRRGHIELMQIAVDPTADNEEQLVFVLDTEKHGHAFLGSGKLRALLEDGGIPKVLHCSYGDASALYNEFNIKLKGTFDTGVADCVLRHVGLNRQRRLDKVICEFVAEARLQHKETFKHIPHMFATRPLPYTYFVYAYEDVVFCNKAYVAMKSALEQQGLLDIVLELSALRAPPLALHPSHAAYEHPIHLSIVVRDASHLLCLQGSDGHLTIPHTGYDPAVTDKRWHARETWLKTMGSGLSGAVANKMRKAVRIGRTLLIEVVVGDCTKLLASARTSHELMGSQRGTHAVVARPIRSVTTAGTTDHNHLAVFQYLHWQSSMASEAAANVILGRTIEKMRVAIVVHDIETCFTLTTAKPLVLQFPSCALEVGADPIHMAEKAFDLYAGPAMRKQSTGQVGLAVMPVTSRAIRQGFESIKLIVQSGNTMYYGCTVPDLAKYRLSFYASTRTVNGFRITPTLQKRHPSFMLCKWSYATKHLDANNDAMVLPVLFPILTLPAASQHSGDADPIATTNASSNTALEATLDEGELDKSLEFMDDNDITCQPCENIPDFGTNPEYDALFEAAVLVRFSAAIESSEHESTGEALAASALTDVAAPSTDMPSLQELSDEQRRHPATAGLIDYLQFETLSDTWARTNEEDRASLIARAEDHVLDRDGLLCKINKGLTVGSKYNGRAGASADRIVLPPRFLTAVLHMMHDRSGHFGVGKTYQLVKERFDVPDATRLRKAVATHIRHCEACQRGKLPTHPSGEGQIVFNGHHPNDVLCTDVYDVGLEEDGYDRTIDFACYFSRQIRCELLKGAPTSEQVADVLLHSIIRSTGVPSEIRSDAGSNLISKAIHMLYKRLGIVITIGTAYHHQLVALVERWHRTLGTLLKVHRAANAKDGRKSGWNSKFYRCIPLLEIIYNNTINPSTGYSPFFLNHLRHARLPADLLRTQQPILPKDLPAWVQDRLDDLNVVLDAAQQSLRLKALTAKHQYDLRHDVNIHFKAGDSVLLIEGSVTDKRAIRKKALLPTDGPFIVAKVLPYNEYVLTNLRGRRIRETVSGSRLIPYFGQVPADDPTWMLSVGPDNGKWAVTKLIDRRVLTLDHNDNELGLKRGERVLQYKVRWVGFGRKSDAWRSLQSLGEIMELVNEYDQRDPRPAEFLQRLEYTPAASDEPVQPRAEALNRRHMRARPYHNTTASAITALAD